MIMDNTKVQWVYDAAEEFDNGIESDFIEVVSSWHEADVANPNSLPQYRVHVTVRDTSGIGSSYCYPAAERGREMGLYLFDTVTNWGDDTVTLRFGLDY